MSSQPTQGGRVPLSPEERQQIGFMIKVLGLVLGAVLLAAMIAVVLSPLFPPEAAPTEAPAITQEAP